MRSFFTHVLRMTIQRHVAHKKSIDVVFFLRKLKFHIFFITFELNCKDKSVKLDFFKLPKYGLVKA